MFNTLIDRLPSNYSKSKDSVNGKLYQIYASELSQIKEVFNTIKLYQDMDVSAGKALDRIGRNVLQLRDTDDDDLYRLLIKTKIIANLSKGDIETINEVCRVLLGKGFAGVQESWGSSRYQNEPAGLILKIMNQAKNLPFQAIDRIIAGGVDLSWVLEYKQSAADIYIASAIISGEETTVYPYTVREIEIQGTISVAMGHNTGVEKVNIYPKKGVI